MPPIRQPSRRLLRGSGFAELMLALLVLGTTVVAAVSSRSGDGEIRDADRLAGELGRSISAPARLMTDGRGRPGDPVIPTEGARGAIRMDTATGFRPDCR